jgi:hypothetical protein
MCMCTSCLNVVTADTHTYAEKNLHNYIFWLRIIVCLFVCLFVCLLLLLLLLLILSSTLEFFYRASSYYESFIYSPADALVSCLKTILQFTLEQLRNISVL